VESSIPLIFIGPIILIAGIAIGAALANWLSPGTQKTRDLEKHLQTAQQELKDYELKVTEHFGQTAGLLNNMVKGYRDIHDHLASGSQELCAGSFDAAPIIPKLTSGDQSNDDESGKLNPPLDYAPRANPYEQGTLHEDYGLEKVDIHSENQPEIPAEDDDEVAVTENGAKASA
jgi:uncharacterized membrane-anchored protein YhcB (DUF1043 family)